VVSGVLSKSRVEQFIKRPVTSLERVILRPEDFAEEFVRLHLPAKTAEFAAKEPRHADPGLAARQWLLEHVPSDAFRARTLTGSMIYLRTDFGDAASAIHETLHVASGRGVFRQLFMYTDIWDENVNGGSPSTSRASSAARRSRRSRRTPTTTRAKPPRSRSSFASSAATGQRWRRSTSRAPSPP
jgi:hypothetical protein